MKPNEFISTLSKSDEYIETIYMNGGCYQFYKILKKIYPQAKPMIDESKGHIVTMIDDVMYDITGSVVGTYYNLTESDVNMCERWSFANNYWLKRDCPNCDEPVLAPPK